MIWKILTAISAVIAALLGLNQQGVFKDTQKGSTPNNTYSSEARIVSDKRSASVVKVYFGKPHLRRFYLVKR